MTSRYNKLRALYRAMPSFKVQPVDMFFADDMGNRVQTSNKVAMRYASGSGFVDAVNNLDESMHGMYRNNKGCAAMTAEATREESRF